MDKLLSPKGLSLVDALPPYDEGLATTLGPSLREAGYDPALVAAALTQSRLRARARGKLGDFADGMVFTADGLEQATRFEVAARHAQRFRAAGVRHVLDLGCGIGVDAMAMASLDLGVTAVDADATTAALAAHNLRYFPQAHVQHVSAEDVPLISDGDTLGAWLDPSRRTPGVADAQGRTRRTSSLSRLSPSWEFVQAVAGSVPATGAKLPPNLPHSAIPPGAEAAWTSYRGEVVECALWWGPLVRTSGRTATILGPRGEHEVTEADADGLGPVSSELPIPGDYLYEPDKAVLQAGLTGAVVAACNGRELANGVGYVVSPTPAAIPFATRYVITEAMPYNIKAIRSWLRTEGVGRLTIKKRGVQLDSDQLRRQLKLDGTGDELTVVITRAGHRQAILAVERT